MCRSRKARRCPPPEAAARPMRKVRIICDDPDATDSSSDEGAEKKIKRIVHQVLYPMINNKTTTKMTYSPSSRVKGVRKRKGGKWAAEIRNPILQKRVWLGTYPTKEEASRAYEMKRLEYEAQAHSVVVSTHVETRQINNNNYYYNNNKKKKKKNESDDNGKVVVEKETSTSSEHGLKELEIVWSDEMMDLNIWSDEFGDSLDQFLPICDGLMGPLPDFDFDFNMDFYDEALDWIDDVSPPARP